MEFAKGEVKKRHIHTGVTCFRFLVMGIDGAEISHVYSVATILSGARFNTHQEDVCFGWFLLHAFEKLSRIEIIVDSLGKSVVARC